MVKVRPNLKLRPGKNFEVLAKCLKFSKGC